MRTCPLCSVGTVTDITHDLDPASLEPAQRAESRELIVYSCGHRVPGPSLASADEERLEVERRSSEDTVDTGDTG